MLLNDVLDRQTSAESFFKALGIQTSTLQIDHTAASKSFLDDLRHPMQAKTGDDLIEECDGTFAQYRNALETALKVGANISVLNPRRQSGHLIAIKIHHDAPEHDPGLPSPDAAVSVSQHSQLLLFATSDFHPETIKDLTTSLVEGYGADPYFIFNKAALPLPGYNRTNHPDIADFVPEVQLPRGKQPKERSMAELSSKLKRAPRQTAADRQAGLRQALQYDAPLGVSFATADESDRAYLEVKEAALAKGASLIDALHLCLEWDRTQLNPCGDDANIVAFYRHEAMKTANEGLPSSSGIKPLFPLRAARVDYFLEESPPKKSWLIADCLPLAKSGMLAGQGGGGKSYFALQMAIAVATGTDFMGIWKVPKARMALYLAAEDDEDELHRRVRAIADGMAQASGQPELFYANLRKNLHVKSMVGVDNRLTTDDWGKEVVQTDYVGRLLHTIAGNGRFGLIIIDPASRFRGGDENRASDATRFVEALECLASATGATVLVIHHVNKWSSREGEQMQQAARGSSAFTDGVRWQMNLASLTANEAKEYAVPEDERGYYVTATVTKNNYAPPQPKVFLKRGDGGVLSAAQLTSKKAQQNADLATRVLDLIREEAKRGALYSKSKFEATFGGKDGIFKTGRVAVRNILGELLQAGRVMLHGGKLAMPNNVVPHARVPGA